MQLNLTVPFTQPFGILCSDLYCTVKGKGVDVIPVGKQVGPYHNNKKSTNYSRWTCWVGFVFQLFTEACLCRVPKDPLKLAVCTIRNLKQSASTCDHSDHGEDVAVVNQAERVKEWLVQSSKYIILQNATAPIKGMSPFCHQWWIKHCKPKKKNSNFISHWYCIVLYALRGPVF